MTKSDAMELCGYHLVPIDADGEHVGGGWEPDATDDTLGPWHNEEMALERGAEMSRDGQAYELVELVPDERPRGRGWFLAHWPTPYRCVSGEIVDTRIVERAAADT